jgi:hypothetical protein
MAALWLSVPYPDENSVPQFQHFGRREAKAVKKDHLYSQQGLQRNRRLFQRAKMIAKSYCTERPPSTRAVPLEFHHSTLN